jgi:aspartate aminotransferase, cytoplasmic
VAQSISKNFGLYGQRVAACHVVLGNGSAEGNASILSQLTYFIRAEYSMAPRWGCAFVKRVSSRSGLRRKWRENLISMSDRIKLMRKVLYSKLLELRTPGSWDHFLSQVRLRLAGLTDSTWPG